MQDVYLHNHNNIMMTVYIYKALICSKGKGVPLHIELTHFEPAGLEYHLVVPRNKRTSCE